MNMVYSGRPDARATSPGLAFAVLFMSLLFAVGCASQRGDDLVSRFLAEELGMSGPAEGRASPAAVERRTAVTTPEPAAAAVVQTPAEPQTTSPAAAVSSPSNAPAPDTTETGKVTIQPDSVIQITVEEDQNLSGRYQVSDLGAIDFGYIGLVILHDMTAEEAAAKIKSILESKYMKTATVGVKISKASYDRISVMGEVNRPGLLKIGAGSSMSRRDCLMRVGGLKLQATSARVKIVRNGLLSPFQAAAEGELLSLVSEDGKPFVPKVYLKNNDILWIFSLAATALGEKQILLLGEVGSPRLVRFSNDEPCTLMYLLLKIGGLPKFAKMDAIRIVRRDKSGIETEIRANGDILLKEGRPEDDVPLQHGDKVIVPSRTLSLF